MQLTINGEQHDLKVQSVTELITQLGFRPPFAVALNQHFVPKHQYDSTVLNEDDRIDVVSPIHGG